MFNQMKKLVLTQVRDVAGATSAEIIDDNYFIATSKESVGNM
ncbi:unannotated protein [freshwater metagenome]|uniref:Unannotated protein n=1 Tax=freshwater metagenome TaxID=449393 RepID=A0A6J6GWR4_9ZZZZ